MSKKRILLMTIVAAVFLFSCSNDLQKSDESNQSAHVELFDDEDTILANEDDDIEYTGKIFLYGEKHGVDKITDRMYEIWHEYYHEKDMRHLFIEKPYYTAEFLNLWMKADNNEILDQLFVDNTGTMAHNPKYKNFYTKIKEACPETIFHGTDVGHQYKTTGQRYLDYLRDNNLSDSEKYDIAMEVIKQGEQYYGSGSSVYRENTMVENFYRALNTLNNEDIMGIYGAIHTDLDGMDKNNLVSSMANQLKESLADNIHTEDLSYLAMHVEPERVDQIEVMGKIYEASYFGKHNMDFSSEYKEREFWRLENAYDDFKDCFLLMGGLPESNYPVLLEEHQVFIVDYTKSDGTVERVFYRVDGFVSDDMLVSEQFIIKRLENLSEPLSEEVITVKEKDYVASYYGKHDLGGESGADCIEYWRLEDAYDDFKDAPLDMSALPYQMYPMIIENGQVFVVDLTMTDGTVHRGYFRSDGNEWRNKLSTEGFKIDD